MSAPRPPDGGSVTKILTQVLSIPSNRSCADCKSALVDASQIYASFRPLDSGETIINNDEREKPSRKRHIPVSFSQHHHALAPTMESPPPRIPVLTDWPVDPALRVPLSHGVLVCALCGAAHTRLRSSTTVVRAVLDSRQWTSPAETRPLQCGGNHAAALVLEAYFHPAVTHIARPTARSTVAERLVFIRAKYEALAFVLPPTGPLAYAAWQRLRQLHPEWEGLWGGPSTLDWCDDDFLENVPRPSSIRTEEGDRKDVTMDYFSLSKNTTSSTSLLPDRLIDYFCVVTASDQLHPSLRHADLTHCTPDQLFLAPQVTDCIPEQHPDVCGENSRFPEHVSTFVFPDGCVPSAVPLPPLFFTLVLTNASGERLYGAVLRLYDDSKDTVETVLQILRNSQHPRDKYPSWLPKSSSSKKSPQNLEHDVLFFPKCLVLLSHYPFFDLFRKFLLQIYRIALTEAPLPMERFVVNFVCEVPLPPPGKVQVKFGFTVQDRWIIERPPENQLPLVNFSFQPLFTCLSVSNILVVLGCLLQETRLVLVSKHYAILGPVSEALLSLLFPFHWQGMYLPILPYSMLEILDAPVPYLVGLHARFLSEVPFELRPAGIVVVDLDRDVVHLGFTESPSAQPRRIPSLPERHALKCKAKWMEFGSTVYIAPPTLRVGTITTGAGVEIPSADRDAFAQETTSDVLQRQRRRDVLAPTDRAFRDNELLVPISGFISEQGQLVSQKRELPTAVDTPDHAKKKFPLPRFLKSSPSVTGENGAVVSSSEQTQENENILEMNEPPGFNVHEIRQAFLRFFTSLFQTYRTYVVSGDFRATDFLASLNLSECSTEFVQEVLKTQMFQNFVEERIDCPNDPEVLFFDDCINAKFNRSKKATLTLRKKETAFLDDTRSLVTETFTPPPPSNFGLPDDGRSYQYSTFPPLNPSLYGKIRTPVMKWNEPNRRSSMMRRRTSVLARANEHAVVEKATRSMLQNILPKRKAWNLEGALKVLSSPFHLPPQRLNSNSSHRRSSDEPAVTSRDRSASAVSSVTLPSEFDPTDEVLLTTAEEVVLIARRKQAILIGILSIFQAHCREHLRTKQHRFVSIKDAVISLQAFRRGMFVRCAFWMLRQRISQLQAHFRGYRIRRLFTVVSHVRMRLYRKLIFILWQKSYTPLSYRTQFWPVLKCVTLVRLGIAEQELVRLWNFLKIQPPPDGNTTSDTMGTGIPVGLIYQKALKVEASLTTTASVATGGRVNNFSGERTQIYERLSLASVDRINTIFSRFSISLSEKKKKACLTEELWMKFEEADTSCELMQEIFPELTHSVSIYYVTPSKKALRRFPCPEVMPRPPENAVPVHRRLSDHIHRAVVEVADLGLRELPARGLALDRGLAMRRERHAFLEWSNARFQKKCSSGVTESDVRVMFMRQELPMRSFSSVLVANKENSHGSGIPYGFDRKSAETISELLKIPSSSFRSLPENSNLSSFLVPTSSGSVDPSSLLAPVPEVLMVPTSSPMRNTSRSFPRRISERFTASFARHDHKR